MTDFDILHKIEKKLGIQFTNLDNLYDKNGQYVHGKAYTADRDKITGLTLINRKLSAFPAEIFDLEHLTILVIIGNDFPELPDGFERLPALEVLDVTDNRLVRLPDCITKVRGLRKLNASYNRLTGLPENMDRLVRLEELNCTTNRIVKLPECLGDIPGLKRLNIKSNCMDTVPECISNLGNLELLNVCFSGLSVLPAFIGKLTRLTNLNISSNRLAELPEELWNLTNLETLNAGSNGLRAIGESIGRLRNLKTLFLNSNELTSLPKSMGRLSMLRTLDASSNRIERLDDSIGGLASLETLFLNANRLHRLPESMSRMSSLRTLDLNSNLVAALPNELDRLESLEFLFLGENRLEKVPESIRRMRSLLTLDMRGNNIAEVPPWIVASGVPVVFKELLSDNEINLFDNPLQSPPVEIVKEGNLAIKSYFDQLVNQGKDTIYEAKIMIVGEPGAGKTSLMNKLFDREYEVPDRFQKATAGIEIRRDWKFTIDGGIDFRAHVWDFGGQQIQYSLHQFFLTTDCVYVLMADKRKDFFNFDYWLNIINILGKNSPVIVLFNEINMDSAAPFVYDEKKYKELFPGLDLVRMDVDLAKVDDGRFDLLVETIRKKLRSLELVGRVVPAAWSTVRNELEKRKAERYISINAYIDICARCGIVKEEDQLLILKYFHILGIALHFREDPHLCDTLFLDPNWAVDGIYAVFTDAEMERNNGIFTRDFVNALWSKKGFTLEERAKLLQLMLKNNFELCYRLRGTSDEYIVPLLLPREKPDYEWEEKDNLMFRFLYPFMPRGITSRLIVRLHEWVDTDLVWNHGAVFRRKGARAQVTERLTVKEGIKTIDIRLSGEYFRCKEFLTIIRSEINRIQSASFPDLPYSEMVPCRCAECGARPEPNFYDCSILEDFLECSQPEIQCTNGKKMVNVAELLHFIFTDEEITVKKNRGLSNETQISRMNREADELKSAGCYEVDPGCRIMVFVEEEDFFSVFIEQLSQFGFHVTPVRGFADPLRVIKTHSPDIIFTGIALPGIDGIRLVNSLKSDDDSKGIPVIVLTTVDDEEKQAEATLAGAVYYFCRPFSFKDILLKLFSIIKNNNLLREYLLASFERKIKDFLKQDNVSPLERFFRENDFTESQKKIIRFMVNTNLINKQIAEKLDIEENALSQRLRRIYERCGVQSRTELLRKVFSN